MKTKLTYFAGLIPMLMLMFGFIVPIPYCDPLPKPKYLGINPAYYELNRQYSLDKQNQNNNKVTEKSLLKVIGTITMVKSYSRVPTLPGKPAILLFTFPCLENAWNLLKKWEISGILTLTRPGKKMKFGVSTFTFQNAIYKQNSFTSMSYLHFQHKH